MGGACCAMKPVNCEYNISNDDKNKNELNRKISSTINNLEKFKDEERCSILINSFCKDTNYIVSYKESNERKIIENRYKDNNTNNINITNK